MGYVPTWADVGVVIATGAAIMLAAWAVWGMGGRRRRGSVAGATE